MNDDDKITVKALRGTEKVLEIFLKLKKFLWRR